MAPFKTSFVGGSQGSWKVTGFKTLKGEALKPTPRLLVLEGLLAQAPSDSIWCLRGITSYERYVRKDEHDELAAIQPALGRPEATCAALIPISKSEAWWTLSQDERRAIFEEQSAHIAEGMKYLPAVARRLYHGRDLGEPFDFLTWFEYSPKDSGAFEELVRFLRRTREWDFVNREVDIRLVKD